MATAKPLNLSALAEHRSILRLWLGVVISGLLIFAVLLILSDHILYEPSVAHNAVRYKKAEATLGISELAGLVMSALAYLRYLRVKSQYRQQVYGQLVADNGWAERTQYTIDAVPSILLGAGVDYGEDFIFAGKLKGHSFTCLIFDYETPRSKTRCFICLEFKLTKAYPMIVLDNRLNDHRYQLRGSNLPDRIPNGVNLSLEGDFNKYFRASSIRGEEQEALELLSPDVMAALEDVATNKVDIEISDKHLYLVYDAGFYSEENIKALFGTADVILHRLDKLTKTWMVSSKSEEELIGKAADAARHKLMFKSDLISAITGTVSVVVFIILMISHATQP